MKGKILISILALGASSLALANGSNMAPATPAAATSDYFDGFYAGLNSGVQYLAGKSSDSNIYTTSFTPYSHGYTYTASTDPIKMDNDIGSGSMGFGAFAGYGKVLNSSYYLGGELYGRYAHNTINNSRSGELDIKEDNNNLSTGSYMKVDSDWSLGGALKMGYLVTPKTMLYLLAGVENSRFSANVSHALIVTSNKETTNLSNSYSFNDNKWAFVPGVGVETMLTDKLSLKAEYTYANYGSLTNHNDKTLVSEQVYGSAASFSSSSNDKVSLNRSLFTLGLAYHFNGI